MIFLYILLAIISYAMGEYFSKLWATSHQLNNAFIAFIAYAVSSVGWLGIMSIQKNIFAPSVVWELSSLIIAGILGVVIFKEHLSNMQWGGVILSIVAIIMLVLGGTNVN